MASTWAFEPPIQLDKSYDLIISLEFEKLTLAKMQLKVMLLKFIKHLLQMMYVIPWN